MTLFMYIQYTEYTNIEDFHIDIIPFSCETLLQVKNGSPL